VNVWIRRVKKKSSCLYCDKEMETGKFQVVCQYFMPVGGGKVWTKRMLFHPSCWLERAIVELESRPVIETRGRRPSDLNDAMKEARNKILRRRASVVQRLDKEMYGEMRPVKLLHLTQMLDALRVEIELYGGVPESWK